MENHPMSGDSEWILKRGMEVLDREAFAIMSARSKLGHGFVQAVQLVLGAQGHVAVTGVGKAGDIGKKIQSTLSSTGTPSYLLHPVEALHGDLGMVRPDDIILALSKSGESQELAALLPQLSNLGCQVILITAAAESKCAKLSDIVLEIGDAPEACPLGMAPSSSTAAMLAVGDALTLSVMELKNIQPEHYARMHPGGALGRSLMLVDEIMRVDADCPVVHVDGTLRDYDRVVHEAPRRAGAAAVVDDDGKLVGIFTHGDLSRLLGEPEHPASRRLRDVMTGQPRFVRQGDRVVEALRVMQPLRIDELPVVDSDHRVVGMIDVQDLLAEGFSSFDQG
jgi:arabinose-5-phosphate isomerase